jgi:KDO2-lipid IV(A) lauroyltransferase
MSSIPTLKTFLQPRYWYAWPVLALMVVVSWLPSRVLWVMGSALGRLYCWLPSPSRRIATRNIELCFPDMAPRDRRRLVQSHFRLSGFALLSLGVTWFAPRWRVERFITIRGLEQIQNAYGSGKNVVLLAPHFIGLDMGGVRLSAEQNYVSMYRKARDPLLEYCFQRRTRFGAILVDRLASLKSLIRHIREGRPFYYLPDQDMGERSSVFIPFFGIPAATVTALSRIAETTNAVVIPCITRILPRGQGYEVLLHPPLDAFPTQDPIADARRMNGEIEKWVREIPDQYMWSFRRFKTRPNNEPSLYE